MKKQHKNKQSNVFKNIFEILFVISIFCLILTSLYLFINLDNLKEETEETLGFLINSSLLIIVVRSFIKNMEIAIGVNHKTSPPCTIKNKSNSENKVDTIKKTIKPL